MAKQTFYPMADLIEAVKDHALQHYGKGGWDVIVECYDDEMIEDMLRGKGMYRTARVRTPKAAIRRVREAADLVGSVRDDIAATAF